VLRILEDFLERITAGRTIHSILRVAAMLLLAMDAFTLTPWLGLANSHVAQVGALFLFGFVVTEVVAVLSSTFDHWTMRASTHGAGRQVRREAVREAYAEEVGRAKGKALARAQAVSDQAEA
jgi:hypothetical protein